MIKVKNISLMVVSFFLMFCLTLSYASTPAVLNKIHKKVADTVVVSKIKALYLADKKLNPLKIQVDSYHGAVVLKGVVNTEQEYERAIALAASVDDVTSVHAKHFTVADSHHVLKDLYTQALVKGLLIKDKVLDIKDSDAEKISVTVKNSVAHLSGTVDSEKEKNRIVKLVRSVGDVKSVSAGYLKVK